MIEENCVFSYRAAERGLAGGKLEYTNLSKIVVRHIYSVSVSTRSR